MFFALPLVTLVALAGLGSLAAIVFGIVYAIANKRPGVAIGSVIAPVAVIFGVLLLAMMFWRSQSTVHVAAVEPVHVHWAAQRSMPAMPAMPQIPEMPPMPPMPQIDTSGLGELKGARIAILIAICLVVATLFGKWSGSECRNRFAWKKPVIGLMLLTIVGWIAMRLSYQPSQSPATVVAWDKEWQGQAQERMQATSDKIRQQQQELEQQTLELTSGTNFQEMLEKLNAPRIPLENAAKLTNLTVAAQTSPAAEISTADGETRLVVPISGETKESLARSAARLEQMIERVSVMADQVSDVGTLLGRAMVAFNERIDSRGKQVPSQEVVVTDVPANANVNAQPVAEAKVAAAPLAAAADVDIEAPTATTVDIEIDREKLRASDLTFEKLRDILSRDGLWRGTVVRFDPGASRITAKGQFDEQYLSKLKNTLVQSKGWQQKPVHLEDLAKVEISGQLPLRPSQDSSPPTWLSEKPKKVGNVWREVIESGEYATIEECYKAADIYLLLATYNHLTQLTGSTARVSDSWRPSLTFHDDHVTADGKIIMANGWLQDDRLQRLSSLGVGIDFIRREIAKDEYVATTERSFGPMNDLYTLVEFTPSVDAELIRRWNDYQREERFAIVGAGAGAVLGGIGMLLGLLKVDTWTKGYYTKRLFLGVPAAIIGGLALLGLAAG